MTIDIQVVQEQEGKQEDISGVEYMQNEEWLIKTHNKYTELLWVDMALHRGYYKREVEIIKET